MLRALLKFFMYILQSFVNILFTPFVALITNLFPEFASIFSVIIDFLDYLALRHIVFVKSLFCVPNSALVLLFDYLAIKYSIYLIRSSIRLGVNVYNNFKM